MQFHTGDWLKDPQLSMCRDATRGIWIDAIAAMNENGRTGVLAGTPKQLARVLRTTESSFMSAVADLRDTGAATVNVSHGVVTLTNRRMLREHNVKEQNRLRQQRARAREPSNGDVTVDVTPMSPLGNGSLPLSFSEKKKEKESSMGELFEIFYEAYPRKENPKRAREEFEKAGVTREMLPDLLEWIERAKQSEQWQEKSKIPHPSTWLHQRRWEGDPPPPPKGRDIHSRSSEVFQRLKKKNEQEN